MLLLRYKSNDSQMMQDTIPDYGFDPKTLDTTEVMG